MEYENSEFDSLGNYINISSSCWDAGGVDIYHIEIEKLISIFVVIPASNGDNNKKIFLLIILITN